MKRSPKRPRKKVISPEAMGSSILAQADMKVKLREARRVAMMPRTMLLRFRFCDFRAIFSRAKGL